MQLKFESTLDYFIFFIVLIKLVFIISAIGHLVLTFTSNTKLQEKKNVIPNLKGMSGMDAVALLGNLKVKVKIIGVGKVKKQSLNPGEAIKSNTIITLELS